MNNEQTNYINPMIININKEETNIRKEPKFNLRKTGPDVLNHEGLDWIYLICPYCGTYSKFKPLSTVIVKHPPSEIGDFRYFHTLAQCAFCTDVIYIHCHDYDLDPDWYFAYEYHHPRRTIVIEQNGIPEEVYISFNEADKCFQAGAFLASAVMCRRTLEAILTERGINPGNLRGSIEKALQSGGLHTSMADVANITRILGNAGAHAGKNISNKEAESLMSCTESIINILYVLPIKAKEMAIDRNKENQSQ